MRASSLTSCTDGPAMYCPSVVRTGSLTSTGELLPWPSCALGSAMQTTGTDAAPIETVCNEISSTAMPIDERAFIVISPCSGVVSCRNIRREKQLVHVEIVGKKRKFNRDTNR